MPLQISGKDLGARAAALHASEAPPAGREGCADCGKLEEIRGLLG